MSPGRAARFLAVIAVAAVALWRFAPRSEHVATPPDVEASDLASHARGADLQGGDPASTPPLALKLDARPLDREPAPASADARAFAVTLRGPDGEAVEGAAWAAFRGEAVLASGLTAEDGRIAFDALVPRGTPAVAGAAGADLELVARHPKHSPLLVTLARESKTVAFEPRFAITGACTVDGREPLEPVKLTLRPQHAFWGSASVPDAAWRAIGGRPPYASAPKTQTDADGCFAFEGLRVGFTGVINWNIDELDGPLVPVGGAEPVLLVCVEVAAPQSDVHVALTNRTALVGRVLDAMTGAGVAGAMVTLELVDGSGWMMTGTDSNGRFQEILGRYRGEVPAELDVSVRTSDGAADPASRVRVPPGPGERDLGDFRVRPRRTVDVVVRDPTGAPIAAAAVESRPAYDRTAFGAPEIATDREGRATLVTGLDATHVHVAALGFVAREEPLAVAKGGAEPLVVTLERGALLDVRIAGFAGGVRVAGASPPFFDHGTPAWIPEQAAPTRQWNSAATGSGSVVFQMARAGRLLLGNVRPGMALTLCALPPIGSGIDRVEVAPRCLAEVEVAPLAAGEHRVVTLTVGGAEPQLFGRVLDPAGAPIAGADVFALDFDAPEGPAAKRSTTTDSEGRFFALGAPCDHPVLVVAADGFERGREDDVEVGASLEIVLRPLRAVTVRVVGPGDAPCPGARVEAMIRYGGLRTAREAEPGVYVLRGLPEQDLLVRVHAAGRMFEKKLREGTRELVVEVPAWGALEIELARVAGALAGDVFLRALSLDATDPALVRGIPAGDAARVRIDALAAGTYAVELVRSDAGSEVEPLSARSEVHVAAGATARVTLAPRDR